MFSAGEQIIYIKNITPDNSSFRVICSFFVQFKKKLFLQLSYYWYEFMSKIKDYTCKMLKVNYDIPVITVDLRNAQIS